MGRPRKDLCLNGHIKVKYKGNQPYSYCAECLRITRAKNQLVVKIIKLRTGCVDCGYDKAEEALDFDHKDGLTKAENVSTLSNAARPLKKILEEIAKCEVVCANCHRIRTKKRKGNYQWESERPQRRA